MTYEGEARRDDSALSLLRNVFESVVDRTLDHIENHLNVYSISDLNALQSILNKINERLQLIQTKLIQPEIEKDVPLGNHSSTSPIKATLDNDQARESNASDNHSRQPIDWDGKDTNITMAQNKDITIDVRIEGMCLMITYISIWYQLTFIHIIVKVVNQNVKERKRFQFLRRNISSILLKIWSS